MLRLDVFPACYVYPKEIRGVRDALRRRQLLVRQRTQLLLSMEGLLKRYGIKKPGVYTLKQWTQRDLHATGLDHFVLLQAGTLLQAIRDSDQRVKEVETSVKAFSKPMEMFSQVKQVPGIGDILGMTIILETGALSRFANAGCYASYCRLVQSRRESNGKRKVKIIGAMAILFCPGHLLKWRDSHVAMSLVFRRGLIVKSDKAIAS